MNANAGNPTSAFRDLLSGLSRIPEELDAGLLPKSCCWREDGPETSRLSRSRGPARRCCGASAEVDEEGDWAEGEGALVEGNEKRGVDDVGLAEWYIAWAMVMMLCLGSGLIVQC